jgi:hypothetical protein
LSIGISKLTLAGTPVNCTSVIYYYPVITVQLLLLLFLTDIQFNGGDRAKGWVSKKCLKSQLPVGQRCLWK